MPFIARRIFPVSIFLVVSCHSAPGSSLKVTNGVETHKYPGVFRLEGYSSDYSVPTYCTGSLIRPSILLTAAHCVIDRKTEKMLDIVVENGFGEQIVGIMVHEKYKNGPGFDVALIKVETPLVGGSVMSYSRAVPLAGTSVEIVGFGRNSFDDEKGYSSGTKRSGVTKVTHTDNHFIYTRGFRGAKPKDSEGPTGVDVAPGHGDSGGPMLDSKGVIIGIAAQVNIKRISSEEPLSVVGAHTQVGVVLEFIEKYTRELGE
jgi:hypothetical protein